MDLIIGGAYQGKLAYAKEAFHLKAEDVCFCQEGFDPAKRCICYPEQALYAALCESKVFALPNLREDAVVICTDVSCGIVPMDKTERLWREEAGRMVCALAKEAKTVTRIFCGLPLNLK